MPRTPLYSFRKARRTFKAFALVRCCRARRGDGCSAYFGRAAVQACYSREKAAGERQRVAHLLCWQILFISRKISYHVLSTLERDASICIYRVYDKKISYYGWLALAARLSEVPGRRCSAQKCLCFHLMPRLPDDMLLKSLGALGRQQARRRIYTIKFRTLLWSVIFFAYKGTSFAFGWYWLYRSRRCAFDIMMATVACVRR